MASADQPRRRANQQIGIRELRQHASVYVEMAEKGYTVDITNRGRLVAQLIPVRPPDSPLERLVAAGVLEAAEDDGGAWEIEPYPRSAGGGVSSTEAIRRTRAEER